MVAFGIMLTSLTVAHAQLDIQAIISNWFDNKKIASMNAVENAIADEQAKQVERLKDELQLTISKTEEAMNHFVEQEKQERMKAIQDYADQLIAKLYDEKDEQIVKDKEYMMQAFQRIMEEAIEEMELISIPPNSINGQEPKEEVDKSEESELEDLK
ncbi:hypothetical protein [Paracerasibacillus soli]|uniref:Uncharacterized protein n=1 Tax=Paracerasibacillus soli TaxID=480284 RepID=A0ABU5CRD2_9BACI|nr:hypothetical protein [Virgibacillus soli]MDY0408934.1 hypothetical protein [Virgibacillus soli]